MTTRDVNTHLVFGALLISHRGRERLDLTARRGWVNVAATLQLVFAQMKETVSVATLMYSLNSRSSPSRFNQLKLSELLLLRVR